MFNKKTSTVVLIFAVTIVMSVCFRLSYWQWQRAGDKQAQLSMLTERFDNHALGEVESTDNWQGANIDLKGKLVPNQWWFLDNQILHGQVGYDLIALFEADNTDTLFVINLGFVPARDSRSQLPVIALPLNQIEVNVQFKIGVWSGFTLAKSPDQSAYHHNVLQYLDRAYFERESKLPISSQLLIAKQGVIQGVTPHYKAVVMSPDKHRAYALQWLLIGLSAGVIAYFATRKKSRDLRT
ncbi:SURF1 family protein [Pseudoalteromonas umbrosa]|uniref:SURF1 family protein n=1 Tax=Pseudoalteromonas umbrosa TaxID=3048489 RepID=UPI0024C29E3E|nr:SURF1 family protein [Pseudoalteromonas sp. B95]MDK1288995.1 SURF1 family protein [Pseudoalteromonas sp. B95]